MSTPVLRNPAITAVRSATLLVMALFLLSGCATYVVTDHDADAGFDQLTSYTLKSRGEDDGESVKSLDSARIEAALNRELTGQVGMSQARDPGEADLLVRYWIEDTKRTESTGPTFGFGFGNSPFGFGVATQQPTREIREGKLIVELVNRENRQAVWRATGQKNLNEQMSPEERRRLIDRLVSEMFKRYPPR
ncbi:MAG: DUF4136 domain-containing protein [Oleiphilaceae bacterium]|nr:DUF4136 domain-containing protein [Oleiphilaceae bacterium]